MHTATFKSVLHKAARLLGLDPKVNLLEATAATLTDYINQAVSVGWRFYPWPDLEVTERRYWRAPWSAAKSYAVGDEVALVGDGVSYWRAVAANTNAQPGEGTAWETLTTLDDDYAYAQEGLGEIDQLLGAWDSDPRVNPAAKPLNYRLSGGRIDFGPGSVPSAVWVRYTPPPNVYTHEEWDATVAYAIGDMVLGPDGHCYEAIDNGTNLIPAEQPAYWSRIDFPAFLAEYAARMALADSLTEDGQNARSMREEEAAWKFLEGHMARYAISQNQRARFGLRN